MHRFFDIPDPAAHSAGDRIAVPAAQEPPGAQRIYHGGGAGDLGAVLVLHRLDAAAGRTGAGLHPRSAFPRVFPSPLRIDGASMVYGGIVSVLWPLVTAYALDYMSHEGHENRFFSFWLMAYGVVLGIAYSEDFCPCISSTNC